MGLLLLLLVARLGTEDEQLDQAGYLVGCVHDERASEKRVGQPVLSAPVGKGEQRPLTGGSRVEGPSF